MAASLDKVSEISDAFDRGVTAMQQSSRSQSHPADVQLVIVVLTQLWTELGKDSRAGEMPPNLYHE